MGATAKSTVLLNIGPQLRFVLYGISVVLDIDLKSSEIERIFKESAEDQVSAKEYELHRSTQAVVVGQVDAYRPETISLSVTARKFDQRRLARIVETSEHKSFGCPGSDDGQLGNR